MNVRRIAAVMIHVPDWKEGLEWYQKAFPQAHRISLPEFDFEFLELNGVQIEVVNADEKVGAGAFGIAVDWEVESFDEAFRHLTESGATLYRGPKKNREGPPNVQIQRPFREPFGVTRILSKVSRARASRQIAQNSPMCE
jgi:hypothetical protein